MINKSKNQSKTGRGVIKCLTFSFLCILTLSLSSLSNAQAAIWYVDAAQGSSGTGTAWSEAFQTISEAISAASADDEIWIKFGTYTITTPIEVNKEVDLYGGFPNTASPVWGDRDPVAQTTTIDGEDSNKPLHCLLVSADATIDGFTIRDGHANSLAFPDGYGGGIYIDSCDPVINQCVITGNLTGYRYGSGIYATDSYADISNCTFSENGSSEWGQGVGAGIYIIGGALTITDCTFSANGSDPYTAYVSQAGGIYIRNSATTVSYCTFTNNIAAYGAGAIYNYESDSTIINCRFNNNGNSSTVSSNASAGGAISNYNSSPLIANCIFYDNSVKRKGGAIYSSGGSPIIVNCTFARNRTTYYYTGGTGYGGGGICSENASGAIANCILWGNTGAAGSDGGNEIFIISGTPSVSSCDINQDGFEGTDGNIRLDPIFVGTYDFHLQNGSPCIDSGDNVALGIQATDYDGNTRIFDSDNDGSAIVDLGPYEDIAVVWYIDGAVGSSGTGDSWGQAFKTIQEAIDNPSAENGHQLWVKAGTYAISSPIAVSKAINIFGGFPNTPDPGPAARNPITNVTVVDGQDTVLHCFYFTAGVILDGFTVQGGNANGDGSTSGDRGGGGIFAHIGTSFVRNCVIKDNQAALWGAGIMNYDPLTVSNCEISSNHSLGYGGGLLTSDNTTIDNCTISGNVADTNGGGIYVSAANTTVSNCDVLENEANQAGSNGGGGGIYISGDGKPAVIITGCTINNNSTLKHGGGIFSLRADSQISKCTFLLNTAASRGGAVLIRGAYSSGGSSLAYASFKNCIMANNTAQYGGGVYVDERGYPEIINCTIAGNLADSDGGGVYVNVATTVKPTIMNSILYGNTLTAGGHSDFYFYYVDPGSPYFGNLKLYYNNFSVLYSSWMNTGDSKEGNIAQVADFVNYNGDDGDPRTGGDSDYHLTRNSAMVDHGKDQVVYMGTFTAPLDDIESNLRPQGIGFDPGFGYDLGAYEYVFQIYQLNVATVGQGTVSLEPPPLQGGYIEEQQVTLTPVPNPAYPGWGFGEWSGDLSGSSDPAVLIMDGNKSITAHFVLGPGDIDGSNQTQLIDAILALQVCADITPVSAVFKEADVNGDNMIGIEEVIYLLQGLAGLR